MSIQAGNKRFFKSNTVFNRWLVIILAFAMLLWVTLREPPHASDAGYGLIILLFVAFQILFPLKLLLNEIFLIQVISLGGGLLFGATTASWATVFGICLGFSLRRLLPYRLVPRIDILRMRWLEAGFILGRQILALLMALLLSGFANTVIADAKVAAPLKNNLSIFLPLLLFAFFHGVSLLLDFLLRRREQELTSPLQHDLLSVFMLELLPLPFIWVTVLSYPVIGIGSLFVLGSVPAIVAILLYRVSSARGDLERRVQDLSTLNRVSQILRGTLNLEKLLSAIHVQVSELLAVNNFYVALYDAENERIWYPLAVKQGERQYWPSRKLEDRLTDRVIREHQPIMLIPNAYGEKANIDLPPSMVTPTAWIGVPLITAERTIGCLALFSLEPKASFAKEDLDLLVILSGQISVSIENALLYEQVRNRAIQLETLNQISGLITASLNPQEVLEQVCKSVTQVCGGNQGAIYLLDPEQSQVWLAQAHQVSEGFIQKNKSFSIAQHERTRCLRTGRPVLVSSLGESDLEQVFLQSLQQEGIRAYGDFPLITPEGQIGFLSVYFESDHEFRLEEIDLLRTFASQAALAVANARLYARTDLALSQRVHQLSILEAVGRELAAAVQSEQLFEMILSYALEFTDSPWGSLGLYDQTTQMIEIKAIRGYKSESGYYSVEKGISGRAVRLQQVINVGDVRQEPDYIDMTGGSARSQLSIPLIHEGRVLGVLMLEKPQISGYTASDQAFISQLANQAAIAVVNARLFNEAQRRLNEQTMLYQISTSLAGKLELDTILQTIQRALWSVLKEAMIGVYLWAEDERCYVMQPSKIKVDTNSQRAALENQEIARHLPAAVPESQAEAVYLNLYNPTPLKIFPEESLAKTFSNECTGCNVLAMPLVVNQQRLGMVVSHLPSDIPLPENEQIQLLRSIVAQGAISIQNALLFSDVTRGRNRLAAVLDSVSEGIVMIEINGQIILVNESTQAICGLPREQLSGKRLIDLPAEVLRLLGYTRQEVHDLLTNLALNRIMATPKTILKISSTQPARVVERASLPVRGSKGQIIGWMIVLRDITEEDQVAQARELITETLVHDLRSPLSAIMGAMEVMEESMIQDQREDLTQQALQVARRGARRVLGMVESLMDIARMQSGKMELELEPINLYSLASATIIGFIPQANEFGVILRNEIPANLPEVKADRSKIARVMVNLLDNALKFTPSGGQIIFSADWDENKMVILHLSDTGPGIPEEFREKIFERFSQIPGQRGRRRGSGLGLTFCKLAIEAHGGRIWVSLRPEGGSIFSFSLPSEGSTLET